MHLQPNNQRIEAIYQMLLELAEGNFFYRIEPSHHNDKVEALIMLTNLLAEELDQSYHHFVYINAHKAYQPFVEFSLVLNSREHIIALSPRTESLLKYTKEQLENRPFSTILSEKSIRIWESVQEQLKSSILKENSVQRLFFKSQKKLSISLWCTITKLIVSKNTEEYTLISSIQIQTNSRNLRCQLPETTDKIGMGYKINNQQDVKALQDIYDYILWHLNKPFPSLKDLAHQFGINEFKLKKGFKQFFGTTVFKFYLEERLKKAHLMIEYTAISLKAIASETGFKNSSHFSRAFKKRFGYNPSELKTLSVNKRDD